MALAHQMDNIICSTAIYKLRIILPIPGRFRCTWAESHYNRYQWGILQFNGPKNSQGSISFKIVRSPTKTITGPAQLWNMWKWTTVLARQSTETLWIPLVFGYSLHKFIKERIEKIVWHQQWTLHPNETNYGFLPSMLKRHNGFYSVIPCSINQSSIWLISRVEACS